MSKQQQILETLARQGMWRELEAELSAIAGEPMTARPTEDLVGLSEIIERTSARVGRVGWHNRLVNRADEDTPKPLFHLEAAGFIFSWTEVLNWPGLKGRWTTKSPELQRELDGRDKPFAALQARRRELAAKRRQRGNQVQLADVVKR